MVFNIVAHMPKGESAEKPVSLKNSEITVREGREEMNIARSFRVGITRNLAFH